MGKVFDVVKGSNKDRPLDVHDYMVKHPASTFFMQMEADGPEGSDVKAGDVIVIDRSISPKKNNLIVITEAGEFRLDFYSTKLTQSDEVSLWGVVTGLLRRLG